MRKVLLIEPSYRNKFPPLGLMKISTYHKSFGDKVVFCKGKNMELRSQKWDRIYIATLFTFYWNTTIGTIKYYLKSVDNPKDIFIGGPMATIMADEILLQKGLENITIIKGLLDKPKSLQDTSIKIVDKMIPDYAIIDRSENEYLDYDYPVRDAFFIHATRGCVRKCEFCAVPRIEPEFRHYIDIKSQIKNIIKEHGNMCNLMIMDNNILASSHFDKIIEDIIESGFGIDNNDYTYNFGGKERIRKRYVDFNQGLDARLLYNKPEKMRLLSQIAIKPLRIAFDHADEKFVAIYTKCMWLAAQNNIKEISNYILFNFEDTPDELYERLKINVTLNKEFEEKNYRTRIWSFPMRFSPIFGEDAKGRRYLGKNWKRKQIRAIQSILNVSHGVVGPKQDFFNRAFGKNVKAFNKILWMPEKYIIYRSEYEDNGCAEEWGVLYDNLDKNARVEFHSLIGDNVFIDKSSKHTHIKKLLKHYIV
jgi:hypothetical protein